VAVQKLWYLFCPAAYVCLVDKANPSLRNWLARVCRWVELASAWSILEGKPVKWTKSKTKGTLQMTTNDIIIKL